eukprot:gene10262-2681_t
MKEEESNYETYFNESGNEYHYKLVLYPDFTFRQKILYKFSDFFLCDFTRIGTWKKEKDDEITISIAKQISNSKNDDGIDSTGKDYICKIVSGGIMAPNEDGTFQNLTKL